MAWKCFNVRNRSRSVGDLSSKDIFDLRPATQKIRHGGEGEGRDSSDVARTQTNTPCVPIGIAESFLDF